MNGQMPQSWITAFDAAMTAKCIEQGCPRSWFDLPAEDRENITNLAWVLSQKARHFGMDSAVEFVLKLGHWAARIPLKPEKK